jgi:hypothetical protein
MRNNHHGFTQSSNVRIDTSVSEELLTTVAHIPRKQVSVSITNDLLRTVPSIYSALDGMRSVDLSFCSGDTDVSALGGVTKLNFGVIVFIAA